MAAGALSCGFSSTAGAVSFCGFGVVSADWSDDAGDVLCPALEVVSFCDAAAGAVFFVCYDAAFVPAAAFVEAVVLPPVGSPAFQLSEAGTLKEIDLPSVDAMIVPAASVR